MFRLLPVAVVISAAIVVLAPGVALASDADQWAWVTARKPGTANYTPAAKDRGNSAGANNTVHRSAPGFYSVRAIRTSCKGRGMSIVKTVLRCGSATTGCK